MAEYIFHPIQKNLPSPQVFLEELHRRGLKVELNLKGHANSWEGIRFSMAGPMEIECFLLHDSEKKVFDLSLPTNAPLVSEELQFHVLDILLKNLGGEIEDAQSKAKMPPEEFTRRFQELNGFWKRLKRGEIKVSFWHLFPWAVALLGIGIGFFGSEEKRLAAFFITLPAILSAVGLTFFTDHD